MPKISIIIPVYNAEKYLRECLDSIINQTLKDIEIICINDYSTDNSLQILQEYAKNDNRIKILKGKKTGAGGARNVGLEIATGEYITFFDADDFLEKNSYEKIYNNAVTNNSDIVVFDYDKYISTTKQYYKNEILYIPDNLSEKVFSIDNYPKIIFTNLSNRVCNKIFKTSMIKENNISFQEIIYANDVYFCRSALFIAKRISILKDILFHYRVGITTNLQSNKNKYPIEFCKSLYKLKEFLEENRLYTKYEQYFKEFVINEINSNSINLKNDPYAYLKLRNYLYRHFLTDMNIKKNEIKCWSILQIFISWIFSIRNFRYTDYKILIILGFRFMIRKKNICK